MNVGSNSAVIVNKDDVVERVDWFQAYLRDLWKQGSALHVSKSAPPTPGSEST